MVLLGALNGSMDDRAFAETTSQLRSAQDTTRGWLRPQRPGEVPGGADDQILIRNVEPENSWVRPATSSDHLPVVAGISW